MCTASAADVWWLGSEPPQRETHSSSTVRVWLITQNESRDSKPI